MNKYITLLVMIHILGAIMVAPVFGQPGNPDFAEAEDLVYRYCDYLKTGNTGAILGVLDGALLKKRARLLEKDGYGDLIAQHYRDADFQIEEITLMGDRRMVVDLVITFQSDSIQNNRLIVDQNGEGDFKIFDENESD
jgi:hypothetical protein